MKEKQALVKVLRSWIIGAEMRRLLSILLLALTLAGCSSKFVYNNFNWLVYWYIDDYIELNDFQEDQFDEHLTRWMKWHRGTELALYKAHLLAIKDDLTKNNLTKTTIAEHLNMGREHLVRLRNQIAPHVAEMAKDTTDDQVIYLFAAMEKRNKEYEDELSERKEEGPDGAVQHRIDEITERIEDEVGRLTKEQTTLIAEYAPRFTSTGDDWLAYRREIQNRARVMFIYRRTAPSFVSELNDLLVNPEQYRSSLYGERIEANKQAFLSLLSAIAPTLTSKQKDRLMDTIDDIIDDIDDLIQS